MTKKTFTAAERQQIAAGWHISGMSQPAYAALHGISDRTLREWIVRHAAPEAPMDAVRQGTSADHRGAGAYAGAVGGRTGGCGTRSSIVDHGAGKRGSAACILDADDPAPRFKPVLPMSPGGGCTPSVNTGTAPSAHDRRTEPREVTFLFGLDGP